MKMKRIGRGEFKILAVFLFTIGAGLIFGSNAFADPYDLGLYDVEIPPMDAFSDTSDTSGIDFNLSAEDIKAFVDALPEEDRAGVADDINDAMAPVPEETTAETEGGETAATTEEPAATGSTEESTESAVGEPTLLEEAAATETSVEEATVVEEISVETPAIELPNVSEEKQADDAAAADLGDSSCETTVDENGNTVCVSA